MAAGEARATSFGQVAGDYGRHWLDPARAIPEIARVLRDGGRLGVIWTGRDRQVDWVAEHDRAAGLARAREALLRRANGAGMVEMPLRSVCWRADRAHRPAPGRPL